MILLKQHLDYDVKDGLIDRNGRYIIMLDIVINDIAFVPHIQTKPVFHRYHINEMIQLFKSNGDKYYGIVGGDMNIPMDLCLELIVMGVTQNPIIMLWTRLIIYLNLRI